MEVPKEERVGATKSLRSDIFRLQTEISLAKLRSLPCLVTFLQSTTNFTCPWFILAPHSKKEKEQIVSS